MLQQIQLNHGLVSILHYGIWPSQAMPRFPDTSTASASHIHLLNVNGHQKLQEQSLHLITLQLTLVQCQQSKAEEYVESGITPQDGVQYQAVQTSIFASAVLMTQPSTTSHTRQSTALREKSSRAGDSTHMPSDKLSKLSPCLAIIADRDGSEGWQKDRLIICVTLINNQLYAI